MLGVDAADGELHRRPARAPSVWGWPSSAAGRILVDDVSLRASAGGGVGREHKVGTHVVRPTGQGVLRITLPRLDFFDLQAQLETDKDGTVRQASATQVSLTPQENMLDFKGKLLSPVDFREIEYEQKVSSRAAGRRSPTTSRASRCARSTASRSR